MQSGHPPDCAIEGGNRNIYLCHGSIVYSWRKAVSATVASACAGRFWGSLQLIETPPLQLRPLVPDLLATPASTRGRSPACGSVETSV